MCFETFDNIINCIKNRFNQTDNQIYVHLQEISIKTFKEQDWEDDLHRSSHPEVFYVNRCSKKFYKIHSKTPVPRSLF